MPRPRVTIEMTTTKVAGKLGMSTDQLVSWIERGILPAPTSINKNGVRYFNQEWLKKARRIVKRKKG